tara:strand:- start:518 stop:685 length:168 start_codon:yes stop_codon:yes gene_type:complete
MSDEVTVTLEMQDVQLLLNLVNQVQVQGKEGMQQVLRIIEGLEAVIPVEEEEIED